MDKLKQPPTNKCSQCGSKDFNFKPHTEESFCKECGTVMEDELVKN